MANISIEWNEHHLIYKDRTFPRFERSLEQCFYDLLHFISLREASMLDLTLPELVEILVTSFSLPSLLNILNIDLDDDYDLDAIGLHHIAILTMTMSISEVADYIAKLAEKETKQIFLTGPALLRRAKIGRTPRNDRIGVTFIELDNVTYAVPFVPRHNTHCNLTGKICKYLDHCRCLYRGNLPGCGGRRSCRTIFK